MGLEVLTWAGVETFIGEFIATPIVTDGIRAMMGIAIGAIIMRAIRGLL